jgi:hypothetical protein
MRIFLSSFSIGWLASDQIWSAFAAPQVAKSTSKPQTLEEAAPLIRPAAIIDAKPKLNPAATRKQIRFGPFIVPAQKVRLTAQHFVVALY